MKTVATVIMLAIAFPAAAQALLGPDGKQAAQKIDAAATQLEKAVWSQQFKGSDNQPVWPLGDRYQAKSGSSEGAEKTRIQKEHVLLRAMGEYMESCEKNYRPRTVADNSKEKEFLRRVWAGGKKALTPAQRTPACQAEYRRIQNELAAGYFSPHLRYTPARPVDNSKEKEFIASVYKKIQNFFGLDKEPLSPEEAAREKARKAAYWQGYAEAISNVTKAGK